MYQYLKSADLKIDNYIDKNLQKKIEIRCGLKDKSILLAREIPDGFRSIFKIRGIN
jgi:hypothetical protein